MRCLTLILATTVTALSALLCVAIVALWLAPGPADPFEIGGPQISLGRAGLRSANGQLQLSWATDGPWSSWWTFFVPNSRPLSPAETCQWHAAGFGLDMSGGFGQRFRGVVPHWFVFMATAALPVLRRVRARRARRLAADGLCPACGYDLRATPDRCPECGMIPAQ